MNKLLLLFIGFLFLITFGNKDVVVEEVNPDTCIDYHLMAESDSVITVDEAVAYLDKFRELLLNDNVRQLAELIHFPIEGDYARFIEGEANAVEYDFNFYRTKEDFYKYHAELFDRDMKDVLSEADFAKALQDDSYSVMIKQPPNIEISFYAHLEQPEPEEGTKPTTMHFGIGYDETDCGICEGGIVFYLRKIDGEIKLVAIQFVG
jgi:hypothetical protein